MENSMTVGEATETRYIEVPKIDIPESARPHSPDDLASLAADMGKEGQLQEIVVAAKGDRFEVVAGVGRMLVARQLGWEKIRCLVKGNLADFDRLRITFAENEEREDASPIYQAQLLVAMKTAKSWDQRELAAEVSMDEATVSQYLSLLGFSAEVQKNFARAKFSIKQLLEIRKLDGDEAQLKAAKEIEEGGLSVKETKKAVHKHMEAQGKTPKTKKPAADLAWKGDEIAINRHYRPAIEEVRSYMVWLGQALPAFAETKPVKSAPPGTTEPEVPGETESAVSGEAGSAAPGEAVVEKMVEPVKEAAAVA